MARKKSGLDELFEDFEKRLRAFIEEAREDARSQTLEEIQAVVVRRKPATPRGRKAKEPMQAPKIRAKGKRRNPWEGISAEKKLERVNAIRKGKGLPPKDSL